jgi:hypothetical protein
MLKKKKTTASGKLVLVKSVRRTRSHRMKFCVQRGLGALPSTSKRRGKSRRDFLLCGPVCINTGIACLFSPKLKRTSERIVKFHSLAQFVSTTLSVLSPFPGCDAAGCHAFLADSWNKAFSSD